MKKTLFLLITLFSLVSCSSDDPKWGGTDNRDIIGSWEPERVDLDIDSTDPDIVSYIRENQITDEMKKASFITVRPTFFEYCDMLIGGMGGSYIREGNVIRFEANSPRRYYIEGKNIVYSYSYTSTFQLPTPDKYNGVELKVTWYYKKKTN